MASVKSSVSLFKSSIYEEQDSLIMCPSHSTCVVFSICTLEKCEYGHFICPKCSIERPEHIIHHKTHLELVKDFIHRSLLLDNNKDVDFKHWEQEVEKKVNEVLIICETFEKTFEDVVGKKLSILNERVTKHISTLQENFKSLATNAESAAIQEVKRKITMFKAKANVEKVLSIVNRNRSHEASRNRKEILAVLEGIVVEVNEATNLGNIMTPIDNLVSSVMTQFNNVFLRLNSLLRGKENTINDIFQEISKQNATMEAEMKKSYLRTSNQSATLSNYSSSSTQQKSQENMKESGERNGTYPLEKDKNSLFYKQKEEAKASGTDIKGGKQAGEGNAVVEEGAEWKKMQKDGKYLLLFKACEEKINMLNPCQLKSVLTYDEIKNLVESYVRNNLRENIPIYSYYGELRDGKKEGFGVDVQSDYIYIGQYKGDMPNGKGKTIFKNNDFYEGDWVNGKFEGKGRLILRAAGTSYNGEFIQGLKNGYGVEERTDSSRYEGYFKDGQKHGKGLYNWAIGERYEGEFIENKMHGKGTYVWNDGTVYVGEWKENKLSGNGLLVEGNGGRYLGSFKNDKKEGYGIYTWSDGWIYRGSWQNGVQNGIGTEIDPRGASRVCLWRDGNVVKYLI